MALPVNVRDLMRAGANLTAEREKTVRLAVAVEIDAPDALLAALEEILQPRTSRTIVEVGIVGQTAPRVTSSTDVVIAALGSGGQQMAEYLRQARAADVQVVALMVDSVGKAAAGPLHQPLDDFLTGEDAEALVRDDLGTWLADKLASKRLALAAGFDFMRRSVSNEFVKSTAWQNALIGGVTIIPGADMPLMTGNQAKMVLQIAAAYGQKLDTERARELIAVVGGGFALRAVARQLLDFVPGFGWALKAGVGYAGTIAMGKAAIAYFEDGADLGHVVEQFRQGAKAVRQKARARTAVVEQPVMEVEAAPYKVEASGADVTAR